MAILIIAVYRIDKGLFSNDKGVVGHLKKRLKCCRCPNYIIWPCVLDRVATFSAGDK